MKKSLFNLLAMFALVSSAPYQAVAQDALVPETIVYPADAGVINVTAAPYNADNTGATDATAAIQAAIDVARGFMKGKTVYLPNGTYRLSNRLVFTTDQFHHRTLTFQGQSRTGTILRLDDNLAIAATGMNLPVIKCFEPALPLPTPQHGFTNSMFSTNIANLTIDTGVGNPGAVGINYVASNQGYIRNVLIKSSDPNKVGRSGLEIATAIPGPAFVKNVTVDGFSVGLRTRQVQYSITLENITLRNQIQYAVRNDAQTLCIRHLLSENTVPAISQAPGGESKGIIVLIDSQLNGGATTNYGIDLTDGFLFARNVTTTGYAAALNAFGTPIAGNNITEYVSNPVSSLQSPQPNSLNLPIQETPEPPIDNPTTWRSVGTTSGGIVGAIPGDGIDDTQAIQNALNSGASTIYFPNSKNVAFVSASVITNEDKGSRYEVSGTLTVGPNVRRLVGMGTAIMPNGAFKSDATNPPVFKFVNNGVQRTIVLENFRTADKDSKNYFIEQASANTLVLRNILLRNGYGYRNTTGFGDVYIEDFHVLPNINGTANPYLSSNRPGFAFTNQRVWARQINPEQGSVNIVNDGATLWILGIKSEWPNTLIETKNGGKTEVLGGLTLASVNPGPLPVFINNNSSVSIAGFGEVRSRSTSGVFTNVITETRGAIPATLTAAQLPTRKAQQDASLSFVLPLYTGYMTPLAVAASADARHSLEVYPNPATADVILRLPATLAAPGQRIRVYTTTGQLRAELSAAQAEVRLPVADWTPGLYQVVLLDSQGRRLATQRLAVGGQ